MVNHGLVVAPLLFIIAVLSRRAGGSEDVRDMGGIAFRAPVLASIFLIVSLATLAMPGSANFVGEFLILLGVFKAKLVIAIIAFSGVVMASVYALRLFIRSMHNRVGKGVDSHEIALRDGAVLVPLVAVIVFMAVYPQLALKRSEAFDQGGCRECASVTANAVPERLGERAAMIATLKGPDVDFAALSPLIALLGGAVIVLLVGLVGPRRIREHVVPALSLVALAAAAGLTIWQWGAEKSVLAGALRIDSLSLVLNLILVAGGACTVLLAWRSKATREAAHGEWHALLLTSIGGMSLLAAAQNTLALFLGLELLLIPLYVLCATEVRRERSLESGLKYLIVGSVGSATLLYGLALIYGATGATDFSAIAGALSAQTGASPPIR